MAVPALRTIPAATVGHHFSSLQACVHRAWCDYHLPTNLKAEPPGFLAALQREGRDHEERLCQKLYPRAVRIPERLPAEDRRRLTVDAMKAGSSSILQAYLGDQDRVGVADVLEHVCRSTDSPTGHVYRVGEFKRANKLAMAHVLQASWYSELLVDIQRVAIPDVFFILGDGSRETVVLAEASVVYQGNKDLLAQLRSTAARPGPHLCRGCVSCPWRSQCIPELVANQHVSLLPGVSRQAADVMKLRHGITRWSDLDGATDEQLRRWGIPAEECVSIATAISKLKAGKAVTRVSLHSRRLSDLTAVSVEFSRAALSAEGEYPPPTALWIEQPGNSPSRLPVDADWKADMSPAAERFPLAVYGTTELAVTRRILREAAIENEEIIDVVGLIENVVHAPLAGLELGQVVAHVKPDFECAETAEGRLRAMREVIDWIADVGTVV